MPTAALTVSIVISLAASLTTRAQQPVPSRGPLEANRESLARHQAATPGVHRLILQPAGPEKWEAANVFQLRLVRVP